MINRVTLMGRIHGDVAVSGSGPDRLCAFALVTGKRWVDPQSGRARLLTETHTVLSHRDDVIENLLALSPTAGCTVYVEGVLRADVADETGRLIVVIESEGLLRVVRLALQAESHEPDELDALGVQED